MPVTVVDPPVAVGVGPMSSRLRLPYALLIALAAGAVTGLAWQPYALWPLLLIGLPALTLVVRDATARRARGSFLLGYAYGLTVLGVTVNWIHVLGSWVAVLLIAFEALWFGLLGLALRLVVRLPLWPVWAAACWSLIEFGYSRVPFGGFGWSRLAYAVVDTPLAGWLPLIGVAGVSLLVAFIAQVVAYAVVAWRTRRQGLIVLGLVSVLLLGSGQVLRMLPDPVPAAGQSSGELQVGIVQGNVPGRGIEALGRARSVTNNHLAETINLMTRARLGLVPTPDFILWPENSTDIDPSRDPVTGNTVQAATQIAGVPILVGAVTAGPGPDERQTTALWWDPQRGVLAEYHKQNLVPFGEWIPFRAQLLPLVPILKQTGAQSVPGTAPGVLSVPVGGRDARVGDIICFELAYDDTVYDTITHGAQVLMVQSNNATYGGTGQIEQQFAITRARAMETQREIAVATTNSVSGFIDRHGTVVERTQEFTAASMVVTMPLRDNVTPAVVLAPWIDRLAALAGLLACAAAWISIGRRRISAEERA